MQTRLGESLPGRLPDGREGGRRQGRRDSLASSPGSGQTICLSSVSRTGRKYPACWHDVCVLSPHMLTNTYHTCCHMLHTCCRMLRVGQKETGSNYMRFDQIRAMCVELRAVPRQQDHPGAAVAVHQAALRAAHRGPSLVQFSNGE